MNYVILSYALYLTVTFYITFIVGKICFDNGEIYLHLLMNEKEETIKSINRLLLIGYYLLNLGYAAIMLSGWPNVQDAATLMLELFTRIGRILLILGLMHYNNLLIIYLFSKKNHKHKTTI